MLFIVKDLLVYMHARGAAVLVVISMKRNFTSQRSITTGAVKVAKQPTFRL